VLPLLGDVSRPVHFSLMMPENGAAKDYAAGIIPPPQKKP
jgi:hypothetical protein